MAGAPGFCAESPASSRYVYGKGLRRAGGWSPRCRRSCGSSSSSIRSRRCRRPTTPSSGCSWACASAVSAVGVGQGGAPCPRPAHAWPCHDQCDAGDDRRRLGHRGARRAQGSRPAAVRPPRASMRAERDRDTGEREQLAPARPAEFEVRTARGLGASAGSWSGPGRAGRRGPGLWGSRPCIVEMRDPAESQEHNRLIRRYSPRRYSPRIAIKAVAPAPTIAVGPSRNIHAT